jgi:hypothetical protein
MHARFDTAALLKRNLLIVVCELQQSGVFLLAKLLMIDGSQLVCFLLVKNQPPYQSSLTSNTQQQKIGDPEGARTLDLQRDRLAF